MNVIIQPSGINGTIQAPSSKSVVQRVFAASLLSDSKTVVSGYTESDDSLAAMEIIKKLGAEIKPSEDNLLIKGNSPSHRIERLELNCGESGLSSRLFAPLSLLYSGNVTLNGRGSLLKRPFDRLMKSPFEQMDIAYSDTGGNLPVNLQGKLSAKEILVDGSEGSQFLSGILMTLPLLSDDSVVKVSNLKSKPYIDITLNVASEFGIEIDNDNYEVFRIKGNQHYCCDRFNIEGDWSGASCLLVAGAIAGTVEVTNLDYQSTQADKMIVDVLKSAGADVEIKTSSVKVSKNRLKAFDFDAVDSPDLFPALVALAANCEGVSRIKGVGRLSHKESDRAETLKSEFGKIGTEIDINANEDIMIIAGRSTKISMENVTINSHNDHRIAMSTAVGAIGLLDFDSKIVIENAGCVNKSYPRFWLDIDRIRY
jgi:3-phosphoshikimate 1-carboxyvinyltransferase